ncbi:hypothetical protein M9H77_03875 [Catharanthus roseus]|uniref:Uncharacterized protein n=1 Tax=Catharanthus roseus TaxID=4058 RepID=A0ACC0CCR6_CATRO|nr:hypothetical protein M9H77_03875 [Catharanthus roseus]
MLGSVTLEMDPVERGRSTVGGARYLFMYTLCEVEKSNVRTMYLEFRLVLTTRCRYLFKDPVSGSGLCPLSLSCGGVRGITDPAPSGPAPRPTHKPLPTAQRKLLQPKLIRLQPHPISAKKQNFRWARLLHTANRPNALYIKLLYSKPIWIDANSSIRDCPKRFTRKSTKSWN